MHNWPYLVLGAVMVAVGVWALRWCIRQIRLHQRAHTWPTAPAFVTRSEIVTFTDSDGDAHYKLDATYRYEVDGARHWGGFVLGANSKSKCTELLERYAVGTELEVHYDPADTATAVLGLGGWEDMLLPIVAVSVLIGAGIWISFTTLQHH